MIRAIVFDIGNVILRFDFGIAIKRLQHKSDPISEEIVARLSALQTSYESGDIARPEFQRRVTEAIRFTGEEREFVQAWEEIFTENLPMCELIRALQPGYPLYLLSNTSDLHVEYMRRTYPIFHAFTDAVYSYRAKCFKPDRAIFEVAIRQFGIDPAETVYIDDLEKNVEAARAAGFQAFQYDHADHKALLDWLATEARISF
jgi:HAD superfamily hydrolase (TIGR01509 family)